MLTVYIVPKTRREKQNRKSQRAGLGKTATEVMTAQTVGYLPFSPLWYNGIAPGFHYNRQQKF